MIRFARNMHGTGVAELIAIAPFCCSGMTDKIRVLLALLIEGFFMSPARRLNGTVGASVNNARNSAPSALHRTFKYKIHV